MGGLYPQSPRWRRREISGDCTEMRKANKAELRKRNVVRWERRSSTFSVLEWIEEGGY